MDEVLLTETRGAVRLLMINRPARLNALYADLMVNFNDAGHQRYPRSCWQ